MVTQGLSSNGMRKFGDDNDTAYWWKVVEEAVIAIQEARKAKDAATREDLYRCVESFITAKSPGELYSRLKGS